MKTTRKIKTSKNNNDVIVIANIAKTLPLNLSGLFAILKNSFNPNVKPAIPVIRNVKKRSCLKLT